MNAPVQEGLRYLLLRIQSMESGRPRGYARWDQYLREKFGDDAANDMILELQTIADDPMGAPDRRRAER